MAEVCSRCGNDKDVLRFCPACGAEQTELRPFCDDPMIGALIADRYEVLELVKTGGMGRVYRAHQRSLDRVVAIKCIHPHLLTSPAVVARFLREARAMSRLSHPNVVSVFDFGRASPGKSEFLFLAMELLSGPDLAALIRAGEQLALPRVASIMRQILAALAEGHHVGITHRDVKPDNIVLEPRRGGGDLVKVIDFGIATGREHITDEGLALGTPLYMSPELAMGEPASPAADLYASGVVLFELLTGRAPFRGATTEAVLAQHAMAVRPDPRMIAPDRGIPEALAQVCVRAIAIDPATRYPTAEALATAIVRAATATRWSIADSSVLPEPPSSRDGEAPIATPARLPAYRPPTESLHRVEESPLVGRAGLLGLAAEALGDRRVAAIALWGSPGTGRSRMLQEIGMVAIMQGVFVVESVVDPPPLNEIGYGGLRRVIAALVGADVSDVEGLLSSGGDPEITATLRALWTDDPVRSDRRRGWEDAAAALRWAVGCARQRSGAQSVVLVIDDIDRIDAASSHVLDQVLGGERIRHFVVVTSSEQPPSWPSDRVRALPLLGIPPSDAGRLLGDASTFAGLEDPVEPLYVEHLRRLRSQGMDAPPAPDLAGLVEQSILCLSPLEQRVLQSVALTGGGPLDELAAVLEVPEELGIALRPLCDAGFIEVHQGSIRATHAIYGRVALAIAPAAEITALHGRVAAVLAEAGASAELRAHHAVRGPPGLGAFPLLEEAARLRALRGDHDGVIAACWEGIHAAETMAAAGDSSVAVDSRVAFKETLAVALLELRRYHEAAAALTRALELADAQDARRVRLLERLAVVAQHLRRPGEAERWRREARELAGRT